MTRRFASFAICAVLLALIVGCASQEPVPPTPPTVRVSELASVSFTPKLMKFEAKILINNPNSIPMSFQKTDYAVDLYDQELFMDSFSGMKRTSGGGTQTVTFPFQIAVADLEDQAPQLLAEGSMRVTFRGQVYTPARYGMDPVPFSEVLTIPIPKIPDFAYTGSQGEPFSNAFRLNFTVTNTNPFAITLSSVKTFLVLNQTKYSLLHTHGSIDVQPGETQPVVLRMENSPGKTLSMALNLASHPNLQFDITGTVTFNTPYGWIFIPLDLQETLVE